MVVFTSQNGFLNQSFNTVDVGKVHILHSTCVSEVHIHV